MKYAIRTVIWRFKESIELAPDFSGIPAVVVSSPATLYEHYKSLFVDHVRERFVAFWLNSANKVIGYEVVTEGLLNASLAHPREVFRGAIVATAASIIIAHNHPSDNPEPSQEDITLTRQIADSGKIIGIPVHDHIIFTSNGYTSLAERGLI